MGELEGGEGQDSRFGQDEGFVVDAFGGVEVGASGDYAIEEGVGAGDVVVVTGEDVGGVVEFEADEVGDHVAVVVEDVVDGLALLEEELGAVEVDGEGRGVGVGVGVGVAAAAGGITTPATVESGAQPTAPSYHARSVPAKVPSVSLRLISSSEKGPSCWPFLPT